MRSLAATVADEMFRSHHPDAEIEHDEEEQSAAIQWAQETAGSPSVESRVEVWRGGSV
jgi:hypothetical protein